LGSTFHSGSTIAEHLTALQHPIEKKPVQENACIEQRERNKEHSCKGSQGGRAAEPGNSEARPPGILVTSEWAAQRYCAALQVRITLSGVAQTHLGGAHG